MIGIIVSGALSFLFVLFSTYLGVNLFKSRNIGQNIQEEVVQHEHKKGTPTMGGIFLILGTSFGFLISHINFWTIGKGFEVVIRSINNEVLSLLIISIAMACVGLIDDYLKVRGNRNLGLTVKQKFSLQLLAGLFASIYIFNLGYSTNLYIFSGFGFDIGVFKWVLVILIFVGITNAVNLTDGLDGLVAGTSSISFAGILVISFWIYRHPEYYSQFVSSSFVTVDISLLISSISGACLGFLWWNTNPAKIIMGDVGAHFIGSLFPLILISLGAEGLILFFCFVFLIEAASVIIQVISFKYRKKEYLKWRHCTIILK